MKKIIFFSVFICILLTGCKNFLEGSDFIENLEDAIIYSNAKEMTVRVQTKKEYGEFVNSGDITKKVGDTISLEFELNASEYVFNKWQVVSKENAEESREEYVDLTQTQKDNKYYLELKLVKYAEDILIQPSCFEIPTVSSILPEFDRNGAPQDSNIIIIFSKPVELEYFFDEETNSFKNIEIDSDGTSLIYDSENKTIFTYFAKPFISEDKLSITIPRNPANYLMPLDYVLSTKDIEISLKLCDLTDVAEGEGVPFSGDKTYTYRINKTMDEVVPKIEQIKIYKTKNDDGTYCDELSTAEYEAWETETYPQNHIGKTVYIYCKASDEGGGVSGIKVKETRLYDQNAAALPENEVKDYAIQTITFAKDEATGFYEGYTEYTLRSNGDGLVKLEVKVNDYALNDSLDATAGNVIKDTQLIISHFTMKNDDYADGVGVTAAGQWSSNVGSTTLFWTDAGCKDSYFGSHSTECSDLGYIVEWGKDKENFSYKKEFKPGENKACKCTLENIDNTVDTYVQITVVDLAENKSSYLWAIPRCEYIYWVYKISSGRYRFFYWGIKNDELIDNHISYKLVYKNGENFVTQYDADSQFGKFLSNVRYKDATEDLDGMTGPVCAFIQTKYECNQDSFVADFTSSLDHDGFYYDANPTSGSEPEFSVQSACVTDSALGKVDFKIKLENANFYSDDSVFYLCMSEPKDEHFNNSPFKAYKFSWKDKTNNLLQLTLTGVKSSSENVYLYVQKNKELIVNTTPKPYTLGGSLDNNGSQNNLSPNINATQIPYSSADSSIFVDTNSLGSYDFGNPGTFTSNFKTASWNSSIVQYEYFWIPTRFYYDESGGRMYKDYTKSYLDIFKTTPGFAFTGLDSNGDYVQYAIYYKKDLQEDQSYLLYGKYTKTDGTQFYNPVAYFYMQTLKNKIRMKDGTGNSAGKKIFEIDKEQLYTSENSLQETYQPQYISFNPSIQYWNECLSVNWASTAKMDGNTTPNKYTYENPFDSNKFYKFNIYRYLHSDNGSPSENDKDYYTSYPIYFYNGTGTNNLKDIVEGKYGISVMADAPCLYFICSSSIEGGYGSDVDEWQLRGAQIRPKQITSSETVDTSLVPQGDYYVVIAHYADGTTLISDVHQKK